MTKELLPEDVLKQSERGQLAPIYMFYGPCEFRLEKVLEGVRKTYLPESSRDFNLEILYGDETKPAEIINRARSLPFLSDHRLIIVRRTENFPKSELERFLPYLENPADSTCLIFVAGATDFKKKFYKRIKDSGNAVLFKDLTERQVVPWIRRMAAELGLKIDDPGCTYLHQVVGNRLRDLYGELEKVYVRYGSEEIGSKEIEGLVIHSRIYTIFELMKMISQRKLEGSLKVLNRFLEEEDPRGGSLKVIGMLNRQIRLLWMAKGVIQKGNGYREVSKKLGLPHFSAEEFAKDSKLWSPKELESGLFFLYQADGRLKAGSRPKPTLENLIVSLCAAG